MLHDQDHIGFEVFLLIVYYVTEMKIVVMVTYVLLVLPNC